MRPWITAICVALLALQAQASERWNFAPPLAVTGAPAEAVFHHLDGAGRKHLTVGAESIAAVWEDNRSGDPQVYVARKSSTQQGFPDAIQVSSGAEAYEPSITAIASDRYVIVYEQDGAVFARVLSDGGLAEPARLSRAQAGHAAIAGHGEKLFASWRERDRGRWFVMSATLGVSDDNRILVESSRPVEDAAVETPVLFPSISANDAGLCIAWEDRRAGHTRLLFSHSADDGETFGEPQSLNEFLTGRNEYDQGNGVTRVSLASFNADEMLAAWMDKRRGGAGYGIFAALGDGESFGPNEKVHGEEGDTQPHYNPATAGNANGDFVVAWDDFRRGDSDIWISVYSDDLEWDLDYSPAVASGSGEQSHPSIALDDQGNLHLLWIERDDMNGPSRLWYSLGSAR